MAETKLHKVMKEMSKDFFTDKGYNTFVEERLRGYIPDVLAVKDDEKIGIECETDLFATKIIKCTKNGLSVVDRIIFVIPKNKKIFRKEKSLLNNDNRLSFIYFPFDGYPEKQYYRKYKGIDKKKKHIIKIDNVPDDVYYKLRELKARLQSKDWVDFLKKITNPRKTKIILNEKED